MAKRRVVAIVKIAYIHYLDRASIWEGRYQIEGSTHCFDVPPYGAQVSIGATFEFRQVALIHVEYFGKRDL